MLFLLFWTILNVHVLVRVREANGSGNAARRRDDKRITPKSVKAVSNWRVMRKSTDVGDHLRDARVCHDKVYARRRLFPQVRIRNQQAAERQNNVSFSAAHNATGIYTNRSLSMRFIHRSRQAERSEKRVQENKCSQRFFPYLHFYNFTIASNPNVPSDESSDPFACAKMN